MSVATHAVCLLCMLLAVAADQLHNNNAPDDTESNSRDVLRPVKIRGPGGRDVKLKCLETKNRCQKRHGVVWHFMSCGNAHGMVPCTTYVDEKDLSNWKVLTGETFNQSTAKLLRATEKDNGLYRCSIKNKSHPKIVTTYELDLVDKAESQPEIIKGPQNQTTEVGARALFQCLVLSKIDPIVKWFRKQDLVNDEPKRHEQPGSANNKQFLQYFNDTYELMKSHIVKRPQDIYLSKLVLTSTTEWDTGFYVCLAINNVDFVYKGAHLNVISTNTLSDEEEMSALSLSWLFLIPVALAVVPLTVWLCCLWKRSHRSTKTPTDQVDQLQPANPRVKYKEVQSIGNTQTTVKKTVRNGDCR